MSDDKPCCGNIEQLTVPEPHCFTHSSVTGGDPVGYFGTMPKWPIPPSGPDQSFWHIAALEARTAFLSGFAMGADRRFAALEAENAKLKEAMKVIVERLNAIDTYGMSGLEPINIDELDKALKGDADV